MIQKVLTCRNFICGMSPHQHLKEWFTEPRLKLIRSSELDRLAGRPIGTFSRFLAGAKSVPLTRLLSSYYPALALLGYEPPKIGVASPPPQMGHE